MAGSEFDDLDFGTPDEVLPPPPVPGERIFSTGAKDRLEELGDFEVADEDNETVRQSVSEIRKGNTYGTIVGAWYMAATGKHVCPLSDPSACDLEELKDFATVVSTLPTVKLVKGKIGDFDDVSARVLASRYSARILKISLLDAAPPPKVIMTNFTLGKFASRLNSVSFSLSKDQTRGYLDVGTLPSLTIGVEDFHWGSVIKNGPEFVEAYNLTYGTNFEYVYVSPETMRLSEFILAHEQVDCSNDGELSHHPRPPVPQSLLPIAPFNGSASAYVHRACELLSSLLKAKVIDPPKEMSRKKEQVRDFLSVLVTRARVDDGFRKYMEASYESITRQRKKLNEEMLSKIAPSVPGKRATMPFLNQANVERAGDVHDFRDRTTKIYRDTRQPTDLRKLDSVDQSGLFQSVTSVAYKAGVMLDYLASTSQIPKGAGFDAFGNTPRNHWQKELMSYCPSIDGKLKIDFYDIKHSGNLKWGGECRIKDITTLEEGFGKGKVLCDDTLPLGNPLAKVASIIAADYSCGFFKLGYGLGAETGLSTIEVPGPLLDLRMKYPLVFLTSFSPHSEEYFVIFGGLGKKYDYHKWDAAPSPGEQTVEKWRVSISTWRRVKALTMYAANIWKSYCAAGGLGHVSVPNWFHSNSLLRSNRKFLLGGFSDAKVKKGLAPRKDEVVLVNEGLDF